MWEKEHTPWAYSCFQGSPLWRVMKSPLLSLMIRPLTLGRATAKMRGAYNAGSP